MPGGIHDFTTADIEVKNAKLAKKKKNTTAVDSLICTENGLRRLPIPCSASVVNAVEKGVASMVACVEEDGGAPGALTLCPETPLYTWRSSQRKRTHCP